MSNHPFELPRRQFLTTAGAGIAALAMPGLAFGQSGTKVTILQGSGSVLLSWAPSYLAEDMGIYKSEGLVVERILNGSGPAGMSALVGGSGTILLNPPGEPLAAAARGQKFKFLMSQSNYQASQIIVAKDYCEKFGVTADMPLDKKMAMARKFKGIRIGMTSPGSLSDHAARTMLRGLGIDPEKDAQVLPLNSVPNALAAMARGSLDAVSGASPAGEIAQAQQGAVILFSNAKKEIPDLRALSGQLIVARASDVEQNPDLYATIIRADTRAMRSIVEDPKGAGEVLYKTRYASMSKDVWAKVWEGNLWQFMTPYATKDSIAAWATMGVMPTKIDVNSVGLDGMIDMRFVDQAVKKIGWKVTA